MTQTRRQIVAFDNVSADGFFSTPDGGVDWTQPEPEIQKAAVGSFGKTDAMLFGRRTYEQFESFWPNALAGGDEAPDPHRPGQRSKEMRSMAVWINESKKIVFSRTRKRATWQNTQMLSEFDPREVEGIKRQPGGDIMIFGSGSIVSQLTQHGLIDEYRLIVNPILLGAGKQLFHDLGKRVRLQLREAKPFASGNVMLTYAPAR